MAPAFVVEKDPPVTAQTHLICASLFRTVQWRFSHYYEASDLGLAHVLDPERHLHGFKTGPHDSTAAAKLVPLFLSVTTRFGLQNVREGTTAAG